MWALRRGVGAIAPADQMYLLIIFRIILCVCAFSSRFSSSFSSRFSCSSRYTCQVGRESRCFLFLTAPSFFRFRQGQVLFYEAQL